MGTGQPGAVVWPQPHGLPLGEGMDVELGLAGKR